MAKIRVPYRSGMVRISSPFGNRIFDGKLTEHKGIDLVGTDKTIVAAVSGVVGASTILDQRYDKTDTWEWGNYVRVDGDDGRKYYYCHLSKRSVRVGQRVADGDEIGIEGNTGLSRGSHLHFQVRDAAGNNLNPAQLLGVSNKADTVITDYAALVCEKCGLERQTREYIDRYKFSNDLWRKLWGAMQ